MGKLTPTAALMRRERLLNSSTTLVPRPAPQADAAVVLVKKFVRDLRRGRMSIGALTAAIPESPYFIGTGLRLAIHQGKFPPDLERGRWSLLPHNHRRFRTFELIHQCEQAPDPSHRVTLGDQRDPLGVPRPRILTGWSELDLRAIRGLNEQMERYLSASKIGKIDRPRSLQPEPYSVGGLHHHLGTIRMHNDPRRGVVDADCRLYGVANLFVAGGSVFPTGGYANPSLTIAALTLRLADHLKIRLAGAAASRVRS